MPNELDSIKITPFPLWKAKVTEATEKRHKDRLTNDCHKTEEGQNIPKTKTKHIIEKLNDSLYTRTPIEIIKGFSKKECRTLIIARYGMLECGKNFRGTMNERCITCDTIDNEEHRLNHCIKFRTINYLDDDQKVPFQSVFSDNVEEVKATLSRILKVRNVTNGRGGMNDQ